MAPPSETSDSFFLCLPRILQNEGTEGPTLHFRESPLTSLCYADEMSSREREPGDCDDSGSGRRDRLIKIVSYFRSMCFYCVILQHLFVFVRDKRTDLSSRQIYKTSSNASLYIQQYDKESSKMSPVHHQV
ncbi:PREDICTED: uncharacterized protein LOC105455011 isoform X1 [Wasmannia auropunctata]|uniref:uncharacterized protein LOC105455011 isoform X1 n=1 Tax=Wasmannia auropunctata TaxID=64793 RepID=UPI0005F042BC|nr:PREDICTED: uncharacterized protein LOC105455011 isoform X1 [Wasmannia auropunctata]